MLNSYATCEERKSELCIQNNFPRTVAPIMESFYNKERPQRGHISVIRGDTSE
ncbi:hypothetical protein HMPREF9555_01206 [Selenomonas artemidis F0399]|uniref:Uncharacterized protein n=1 Tax=Selenomonas artemidis F0399 TaxID=749551 RepID=E7N2J0_9FIRM|nr:hypothetical protein HMPREF9555_01206 [Selenomonas artemidis F0399]